MSGIFQGAVTRRGKEFFSSVLSLLFGGYRGVPLLDVKQLIAHLNLVLRLRMSGAVPLHPPVPSWHALG
jgi:hypothetical protein